MVDDLREQGRGVSAAGLQGRQAVFYQAAHRKVAHVQVHLAFHRELPLRAADGHAGGGGAACACETRGVSV